MSNEPDPNLQFERLWTDFLEGELTDEGGEQLQSLVAAHPELLTAAVDQYEIHRLLGVLMNDEPAQAEWFVRQTLDQIAAGRDEFAAQTMERIRRSSGRRAEPALPRTGSRPWLRTSIAVFGGWVVAGMVLLALIAVWNRAPAIPERPGVAAPDVPVSVPQPDPVRFSRIAQARFYGELSPAVHSAMTFNKTYVLTGGIVELSFPTGAVAIVEGPAVFRAPNGDRLELDAGLCSVYAPAGAEGFRVDTPDTNVVDRGTRFTVNVSESNETEVQVIEGIADVYRKPPGDSKQPSRARELVGSPVRLTQQDAVRVLSAASFKTSPAPFRPGQYRSQLPDRIISYTASTGDDDRADELQTVTVQRGGVERVYSVDELIPVELIAFRATEYSVDGHLLARKDLAVDRKSLAADRSLATGIGNPGGSPQPLTTSPALESDPAQGMEPTPGIAFRFRDPVRNGPGPDIVFFEIHPITSPTDGDPFHIGPLELKNGHQAITVTNYDLSLHSLDVLPVTQMYAYKFPNRTIGSLDDLLTASPASWPVRFDYRILAVGIDLSDMGFRPDEEIDGLFIQDADNGHGRVDPVFIGGLP